MLLVKILILFFLLKAFQYHESIEEVGGCIWGTTENTYLRNNANVSDCQYLA
jgi:hypothetical protein